MLAIQSTVVNYCPMMFFRHPGLAADLFIRRCEARPKPRGGCAGEKKQHEIQLMWQIVHIKTHLQRAARQDR
jgi:hypothetical protein